MNVSLKKKLFGDKAFYKMVLLIVIPLIIQNAISNFVNLLDNMMVGRLGTDPMTGVSIVNELIFVFNLTVFGSVAGPGIFSAQFHGANDEEGVRNCLRFKLIACIAVPIVAIAIFLTAGDRLISLFLTDTSDPERVRMTLSYAKDYLGVCLWGLVPFALSNAFASTMRETGKTRLPMVASVTAVFANLLLNTLLIFGKLGFPALGVKGAALATVISRYIELGVLLVGQRLHACDYPYQHGLLRTLRIPKPLLLDILVKGFPLMLNELLWSLGFAATARCYSLRGLNVVSAMNITNTVSQLFSVIIFSMGSTTGIVIGQSLGANEVQKAKQQFWWLTTFSILSALATGLLEIALSGVFPLIYNTSDEIRALSSAFMKVYALCMPILSFVNVAYFTIRSGGKTLITFIFDSGFTCLIMLPLVTVLAKYTTLPVVAVYACAQLTDLIKCAIGAVFIKKGAWIQNIVTY